MQQTTREFSVAPVKQKQQLPQINHNVQVEKPTFRDIARKQLEQLQEKRQRMVGATQSAALSTAVKTKGVDNSFEALAQGEFRATPEKITLKREGEEILRRLKASEKRLVADDIQEDPLFQQKLGREIQRQREVGGGIDLDEAEKNALAEYQEGEKEKPEEEKRPPTLSEKIASIEDKQYALGQEFLQSREQHAIMMENIAAMLMATAESLQGKNEDEQNLSLLDLLMFLLQSMIGGMFGDEPLDEETGLLGTELEG